VRPRLAAKTGNSIGPAILPKIFSTFADNFHALFGGMERWRDGFRSKNRQ
jgi:hypothetical protein